MSIGHTSARAPRKLSHFAGIILLLHALCIRNSLEYAICIRKRTKQQFSGKGGLSPKTENETTLMSDKTHEESWQRLAIRDISLYNGDDETNNKALSTTLTTHSNVTSCIIACDTRHCLYEFPHTHTHTHTHIAYYYLHVQSVEYSATTTTRRASASRCGKKYAT